ncbi:MAG: hypothetical protein KAJ37_00675 [Candidatus Krumholzibacteria bacterium]|nr:hypothetical protein [Candidatus Krumholzibacteria bacterium]
MKNKTIGGFVAVCTLLALASQPVWAEPDAEAVPEWAEEGRNELGLFLGAADSEGEWGASVGLDYEYRLSRLFGIGGLLEYTGADFRDGVAAVPFYLHPWKELKLVAAPGVNVKPAERIGRGLVRIGAEYGFDVRRGFEIAPAVYVDFTSEDVTIVFGAAIARSF